VTGSSEHGTESLGSTKGEEFLHRWKDNPLRIRLLTYRGYTDARLPATEIENRQRKTVDDGVKPLEREANQFPPPPKLRTCRALPPLNNPS
jgi:hypothetical protein